MRRRSMPLFRVNGFALARPSLVALSGQSASFLAGGEIQIFDKHSGLSP